ncbi:Cof-type HAD-IIB family hydrolase [Paenibacillus validus]|uniref:Cof-type HAD-IIB family hydrolase n=1 Tax=Paenibacillus TaxID=44249 RepID=UPI0006D09E29|nr:MULTISPECIES: Cof-type HAD-IIB family hydrolase [Paenibacillus]MED4599911.1 Cof-type HAD-IIB family hydrolase [Paenibacillus validus]MED4609095.1 Cof-type HAD-IIB family hydrolase [Paenibacillus validus]
MNETIVFFDIDGTLLDERNRLPQTTKQAIGLLQRSGIRTAIATGRTPSQFEWIREELNIDTYVSANGQYVVYEGREIYAHRLPPDRLRDMCEFAEERGHCLAFSSHAMLCASHAAHPLIDASFGALSLEYPPVDPLFYTHSPVYQAYLFCPVEEEPLYTARFPEYRYHRWHRLAADVMPAGGSKAVGIQKLLEAVGAAPAQCYAFGDGLNDKEMLAWVGTGIAMGNASDEVKAVADRVTATSSEDGIWHGLKQVGLI